MIDIKAVYAPIPALGDTVHEVYFSLDTCAVENPGVPTIVVYTLVNEKGVRLDGSKLAYLTLNEAIKAKHEFLNHLIMRKMNESIANNTFRVGDSVICTDSDSPFYNKTGTISSIRIDENGNATVEVYISESTMDLFGDKECTYFYPQDLSRV